MPYKVNAGHSSCPNSRPYGVISEGSGRLLGCHATRKSANSQMRALYASEGEKKMIDKQLSDIFSQTNHKSRAADIVNVFLSQEEPEIVVQDESFEKNRANLLDRFFDYMDKTFSGHEEKAIKRENGIDYPPKDYAYVPDPNMPSSWKLRLTEEPGKVTVAQLGRAAAALSSGGFRGNRAEIPPAALSAVKRRIRAEYLRLGVREEQIPASVKEIGGFHVWKQQDGKLRWFAIYSNSFRDNDYPPEIISKESHELFVDMVDNGLVDYPELWHFHVPGTTWGKADWVGFSDGFALASGTVYEGHENEAELLMGRDDIGVSHGMPLKYILRDEEDNSVIRVHVTTEISPLPMESAANKMTSFFIKEQEEMPLNQQKKQHLLSVGFSEDDLLRLEAGLKETAVLAVQAGIESKESNEAIPVEEVKEEEVVPVEVKDAQEEEVTPVAENTGAYLTTEEAKHAFLALAESINDIARTLTGQMEALTSEFKSLKEQQVIADQKSKEGTPSLSIAELIAQAAFNNKNAEVDGRSALAKSKPQVAKSQAAKVTGIPFIDSMFVQQGE